MKILIVLMLVSGSVLAQETSMPSLEKIKKSCEITSYEEAPLEVFREPEPNSTLRLRKTVYDLCMMTFKSMGWVK